MQASDDNVRSYILSAIEAGTYPAGGRLPTERAMSDMLAVGRGAVRSALARLEGEGRIVRIAGSGTYVADQKGSAIDLSEETSPLQVMEARLTLEPPLVRLVAANATGADFSQMEQCIRSGAAAGSIDQFEHWDAAFHEAIAFATHNPIIIATYKLVTHARNNGSWGALKRKTLTDAARAAYQQDHEEILEALRQRDIEAAEAALRDHLVAIRVALLGH